MSPTDVSWTVAEGHLLRAIELAQRSREKGNHPFGSVLVDTTGAVVLEAENTVVTGHDVTAHAELNLVRAAGMEFDLEGLARSALYTSTEPCAMCSGCDLLVGHWASRLCAQ